MNKHENRLVVIEIPIAYAGERTIGPVTEKQAEAWLMKNGFKPGVHGQWNHGELDCVSFGNNFFGIMPGKGVLIKPIDATRLEDCVICDANGSVPRKSRKGRIVDSELSCKK